MFVRASLPTFLILGALSLTSTAQAFDRPMRVQSES